MVVAQVYLGRPPNGNAAGLEVKKLEIVGLCIGASVNSYHKEILARNKGPIHSPIVCSTQTGWLPVNPAISFTSGK